MQKGNTLKDKKYTKYSILILSGFILAVSFNNCGEGFVPINQTSVDLSSLSSTSLQCEAVLVKTFESGFRPFVQQNCASCHSNGPGFGVFANPDLNSAFLSFKSIGAQKIVDQATSNHKQPNTGTQHLNETSTLLADWKNSEIDYNSCLQSTGNADIDSSGDFAVRTIQKMVPANLNTTFVRMEWDLESQSSSKLPVVAGIDIRRAFIAGNPTPQGYEFRNPTLRLKTATTESHYVRSLNILVNGALQSEITTYKNIEATIANTTNFNLASGFGNAWAVRTVANADTISLDFLSLRSTSGQANPGNPNPNPTPTPTPTPTLVTYTQLTAAGGVFANSCIGCHSNSRAAGGLNIQNYTQAKAAAANIVSRMNNAANPMPTGGLLSQTQRDLVSVWVNGGTPQ